MALGPGGTLSITYVAPTSGKTASVDIRRDRLLHAGHERIHLRAAHAAALLDTRNGTGLSGPFIFHIARTFQVTGRGGVPATPPQSPAT